MSKNKGLEAHCWADVGTYVTNAVKEMTGKDDPGPVRLHISVEAESRTKHVVTVVVGRINNLKK